MAVERPDLNAVLTEPTGTSSAGYPYLSEHAWRRFRDWVPHLFRDGLLTLAATERYLVDDASTNDAARVVRQVVNTAQVTAPPDLWLIRGVVHALWQEGLAQRLLSGDSLVLETLPLRADELVLDLRFLLSRGLLVRTTDGYRLAPHESARSIFELGPLAVHWPGDLSRRWQALFMGADTDEKLLLEVLADLPELPTRRAPAWLPTASDVSLGWRWVPMVLGMRAANQIEGLTRATGPAAALNLSPALTTQIRALCWLAGAVDEAGHWTSMGRRMLRRGPGPYGIIETYHRYLSVLPQIWREGRGRVHVQRGANVAASQDANRKTFRQANDSLDQFCAETGFSYDVYIEHAVGMGESLRQRWSRSGEELAFVGADLEDAALSAAKGEQSAGRLPPNTTFIQADIGKPGVLVAGLLGAGLTPEGAVMVVGNGFHEVRCQTDQGMVDVLRGYEEAGLLLLFTEESALAVDDLLETAWNTYHAGFKYVHERSGQGLRPATAQPASRLGPDLPASWTEVAEAAGYVRAERYCTRGRTIYPYPPASGQNPSISVTHFFVPKRLWPSTA
ncbi:MAG: hypothetical protein GWP91_15765 [Rhodobacterales bacterium]|nr:hypothetical protein [Rhodobacterales bacterium]